LSIAKQPLGWFVYPVFRSLLRDEAQVPAQCKGKAAKGEKPKD
jgi:hypothetical protein